MRKRAIQTVQRQGGDVSDSTEVLSQYEKQFGAFRGQTFKWVIENALGILDGLLIAYGMRR